MNEREEFELMREYYYADMKELENANSSINWTLGLVFLLAGGDFSIVSLLLKQGEAGNIRQFAPVKTVQRLPSCLRRIEHLKLRQAHRRRHIVHVILVA